LIEIIKSGIQERLSNATYIPDGINNVIRKKEKQAEQLDFTDYLDSHFVVKTEKNDINSEEISDLSNINTINEADNFNYVFDINDEVVFFDSNS
ncbi:DNA mismatch repair protein MutL, partial [Streptococcus danieliae]|nr:DNA mismatch repair protein MutL [Streptococcus danieliae]